VHILVGAGKGARGRKLAAAMNDALFKGGVVGLKQGQPDLVAPRGGPGRGGGSFGDHGWRRLASTTRARRPKAGGAAAACPAIEAREVGR
jgi:hypothetical protein